MVDNKTRRLHGFITHLDCHDQSRMRGGVCAGQLEILQGSNLLRGNHTLEFLWRRLHFISGKSRNRITVYQGICGDT